MNIFKLICACVIFTFAITAPAFSKDRSYKFNFNGHVSDEIQNQEDFANYKAAEYTLKKGYTHFVVENARRYERKSKDRGLSSRSSSRARPKTELNIHVYDTDPNIENALNAASLIEELGTKYSE